MSGKDRVLLIEDQADDCRLMLLVLRDRLPGHTVETASDAVSFAEWVARGGFTVAVVDQELAWADAGQVLAALRRHHPECRLLMVAAPGTLVHGLPAELQAMAEVLPRTSAGLLALPERICCSLPVEREDPSPPPQEPASMGGGAPGPPPNQAAQPGRASTQGWTGDELEELAYALSHDLLGTVHLVGQYARLLKEGYQGRLDADASRYLEHLLSGSRRLTEMVEAVLGYLRSDKQDDDRAVVDFSAVAEEAVQHLGALIEEAGARVHWGPLPTLAANRYQMVQLFQNLIGNAIKYRREEPPRIEVSALEHANRWKFAIKDNGTGIDTDNQRRIFRLFHRLGAPNQSPGSGIGLAMCKRIVERHGGRIWVESRLGNGSTFFFTISKDG